MTFGVVDVHLILLLGLQHPVADDQAQQPGCAEDGLRNGTRSDGVSGALEFFEELTAIFCVGLRENRNIRVRIET